MSAFGCSSYSRNLSVLAYRVADYVDRILRGTKPADLPADHQMVFELALNLKTAKKIGETFAPNNLARADRVITQATGNGIEPGEESCSAKQPSPL